MYHSLHCNEWVTRSPIELPKSYIYIWPSLFVQYECLYVNGLMKTFRNSNLNLIQTFSRASFSFGRGRRHNSICRRKAGEGMHVQWNLDTFNPTWEEQFPEKFIFTNPSDRIFGYKHCPEYRKHTHEIQIQIVSSFYFFCKYMEIYGIGTVNVKISLIHYNSLLENSVSSKCFLPRCHDG